MVDPVPFSPVHNARKFSAVLGTTSANSSKTMRPTEMAKRMRYIFKSSPLHGDALSITGQRKWMFQIWLYFFRLLLNLHFGFVPWHWQSYIRVLARLLPAMNSTIKNNLKGIRTYSAKNYQKYQMHFLPKNVCGKPHIHILKSNYVF